MKIYVIVAIIGMAMGAGIGAAIKELQMRPKIIDGGIAHYDQTTGDFTWGAPIKGGNVSMNAPKQPTMAAVEQINEKHANKMLGQIVTNATAGSN